MAHALNNSISISLPRPRASPTYLRANPSVVVEKIPRLLRLGGHPGACGSQILELPTGAIAVQRVTSSLQEGVCQVADLLRLLGNNEDRVNHRVGAVSAEPWLSPHPPPRLSSNTMRALSCHLPGRPRWRRGTNAQPIVRHTANSDARKLNFFFGKI